MLGWWHSQYDGKNKIHVPNHQADGVWMGMDGYGVYPQNGNCDGENGDHTILRQNPGPQWYRISMYLNIYNIS